MKVTIEKGELVIRLPVKDPLEPSGSGKTLLVASSHGPYFSDVICPKTDKRITVSVNAYIKP